MTLALLADTVEQCRFAGGEASAPVDASVASPCPAPLHIGSLVVDPPVLQAPMAGYTNYAFRQIVRELGGAGLQATEMVNAKGFLWLETQ